MTPQYNNNSLYFEKCMASLFLHRIRHIKYLASRHMKLQCMGYLYLWVGYLVFVFFIISTLGRLHWCIYIWQCTHEKHAWSCCFVVQCHLEDDENKNDKVNSTGSNKLLRISSIMMNTHSETHKCIIMENNSVGN